MRVEYMSYLCYSCVLHALLLSFPIHLPPHPMENLLRSKTEAFSISLTCPANKYTKSLLSASGLG